LLSWELATLLTWRYLSLEIFSFSYQEFLEFSKKEQNLNSFKEYIQFGWMPEVLLLDWEELKRNYIKNTLNSIFFKDIVSRFTIRNTKLLEKIFQYLQTELWNIISITNIWNYIKNIFKKEISLTTISNYMNYLVFPFLVYEINRYDIKWKKILDYTAKYYFSDIWIRNSNFFNFASDIWKILENLVFLKLISDWYKVYVWEFAWREVDFVAEKNWEKKYVQVVYLLSSEKVIEREFWNLLKIPDNYEKIVVSMDESFWNTYKWIKNINILDFLNL
jgi:predicted AAA+ superfamily ATPase